MKNCEKNWLELQIEDINTMTTFSAVGNLAVDVLLCMTFILKQIITLAMSKRKGTVRDLHPFAVMEQENMPSNQALRSEHTSKVMEKTVHEINNDSEENFNQSTLIQSP